MFHPTRGSLPSSILATLAKWGGRLTAVLLFLFWGAFFVEHMSEWFLRSNARFPPAGVWVQQLAHFGMLVGLGLMLKWERLGGLVLLIATVAFFGGIGMHRFPFVALVNVLPIALFGIYRLAVKHQVA